jgi:hypothetical protein
VNLQQLFITPSLAWTPVATQAFGAAFNIAYQRFSAEGLNVFATSSIAPADPTNRGTDSTFFNILAPGLIKTTSRSALPGNSRAAAS